MRATRVKTPDGHVWLVRRRWARRDTALRRYLDRRRAARRRLWLRRGKQLDMEMAGPDSEAWMSDVETAQGVVALISFALVAALPAALGLLGWLVVTRVVPLVPHPAAVGEGLGALIVVAAAALLINRPWLVVAQRRGLRAPWRVWRVNGWWRSRRCRRDVVAAIASGALDAEPGVPPPWDPRSSWYRSQRLTGLTPDPDGSPPTGPPIGWLEPGDEG